MKSDIAQAKGAFNKFFQADLYGRYDDDDNIILSRGAWNDDTVKMPELFKFCLGHTLDKHWVGYSDSLGHENVYKSLVKRFNQDLPGDPYTERSFALTMGNVATMGFVYKELSNRISSQSTVIATVPYYPSIIKTISNLFHNITFVDSLLEEKDILKSILSIIASDPKVGIIHLSNFIGVEGRVYSSEFFKAITTETRKRGIYVVIDEGLWYEQLSYPKEIAQPNVIRLVSPSKKYGIPGMKIGILIADTSFIQDYYEEASSGYGGPASIFFLLIELLMLFEYVWISKDKASFSQICDTYTDIALSKVEELYEDYCACITDNLQLFLDNRKALESWGSKNEFVEKIHLLGGLNFFVKINSGHSSMYAFFEDLISKQRTSVMPSACFGDSRDEYIRISILEDREQIRHGLSAIEALLKYSQRKDKI
jgi:aspartate/methionine/tyrosine aminotransferase